MAANPNAASVSYQGNNQLELFNCYEKGSYSETVRHIVEPLWARQNLAISVKRWALMLTLLKLASFLADIDNISEFDDLLVSVI